MSSIAVKLADYCLPCMGLFNEEEKKTIVKSAEVTAFVAALLLVIFGGLALGHHASFVGLGAIGGCLFVVGGGIIIIAIGSCRIKSKPQNDG
jgi:small neutral amino acid transporter SnatA (MarC family)